MCQSANQKHTKYYKNIVFTYRMQYVTMKSGWCKYNPLYDQFLQKNFNNFLRFRN